MSIRDIDIDKIAKGDRSEMRYFVDQYKRPLYAFLYQMLKDHDTTDDISQEVFIKVFKSIKRLKDRSSFKSWVFRIASNTAITELNRRNKQRADQLEDHFIADDEVDIHQYRVSFKQALEDALKHLNPTQKVVFTLRHINGNSTRESSEILKCSEGHVKKQLHLAVKTVRKKLLDKYPEMDWNLS